LVGEEGEEGKLESGEEEEKGYFVVDSNMGVVYGGVSVETVGDVGGWD